VHVWRPLRYGNCAQAIEGDNEQIFELHYCPDAQTMLPQKHVLLLTWVPFWFVHITGIIQTPVLFSQISPAVQIFF